MRLALPLAALALAAPASAADDSAFGRWITDDGAAIVAVAPCGAKLCGRIEKVLNPRAPANDINNPDPARRKQPLVGTTVLSGYTRTASGWKDGRAYDPKSGKAYASRLRVLAGGKLEVTGCVLVVCRSKIWTRVKLTN